VSLQIIHETEEYLAISKPTGCHSTRGKTPENSVEEWLEAARPEQKLLPEAGLCQRLDYLTSGLLLAAKTKASFDKWSEYIRTPGSLQKFYLAMVHGKLIDGRFSLYFSARHKSSQKMTVSERGPLKERGRCEWRVLECLNDLSLLEVELVGPGKRHEIRAGFAHLGHPIYGDRLYGSEIDPAESSFGLHSWRLHWGSQSLLCPHPASWEKAFPNLSTGNF